MTNFSAGENTASWRTCGSKTTDESTFHCLSLSEPWVSASNFSVETFGCGPLGYATSRTALDVHYCRIHPFKHFDEGFSDRKIKAM